VIGRPSNPRLQHQRDISKKFRGAGHLLTMWRNLRDRRTGRPNLSFEKGIVGMRLNSFTKGVTLGSFALLLLLGSGISGVTARADDRDDRRWDRDSRSERERRERERRERQVRELERRRIEERRQWEGNRDRGGLWNRDRRFPGRTGGFGGLTSYGRNVAEQRGFSTGLDRGRDDGHDHRSYNPNNSDHYRDGDSGYRSEFGSREAYRSVYRSAFSRGYSQGYRQTARGRRW